MTVNVVTEPPVESPQQGTRYAGNFVRLRGADDGLCADRRAPVPIERLKIQPQRARVRSGSPVTQREHRSALVIASPVRKTFERSVQLASMTRMRPPGAGSSALSLMEVSK